MFEFIKNLFKSKKQQDSFLPPKESKIDENGNEKLRYTNKDIKESKKIVNHYKTHQEEARAIYKGIHDEYVGKGESLNSMIPTEIDVKEHKEDSEYFKNAEPFKVKKTKSNKKKPTTKPATTSEKRFPQENEIKILRKNKK